MNTHEIKGIQPDIKSGIVFIDMFVSAAHKYRSSEHEHLKRIFKEQASHFNEKFYYRKLAGFFLNLDNSNQLKLLSDCGFNPKQLELPLIEKWEDYGNQMGMNDWGGGFTMENVRSHSSIFLNEWDAYPHALVWIRRFLLYANNNSISDTEYDGDKFGEYSNWAEYFQETTIDKKQKLISSLIQYC